MYAERLCREHADVLLAFHCDPRVMATLGGVWTADRAQAAMNSNLRHWEEHGFGIWIFRDRTSGAFVGRGGLRRVDVEGEREVEIAYAVAADRWGCGLATEMARASAGAAFSHLGLKSVVAFTLPTNVASRRVMEKTGLTLDRDIVHANLPHVLYRLTRDAWRRAATAEERANG